MAYCGRSCIWGSGRRLRLRWDDERDAVEFTVVLGEYQGTVRVHRRVFRRLLDQSPTPERCLQDFHLQRTRFELAIELKLRRRQLTDDGNVEITERDLREHDPPPAIKWPQLSFDGVRHRMI